MWRSIPKKSNNLQLLLFLVPLKFEWSILGRHQLVSYDILKDDIMQTQVESLRDECVINHWFIVNIQSDAIVKVKGTEFYYSSSLSIAEDLILLQMRLCKCHGFKSVITGCHCEISKYQSTLEGIDWIIPVLR